MVGNYKAIILCSGTRVKDELIETHTTDAGR